MLAIDWERTVGGQGRRDRMPIKRKLATMTYTIPLEIGMSRDGIRMPGGLIVTQEIEQFLRTLVAPFRYTQDFDDLPIPFRAVATDMVAGEVVILDSGDLSEAMRASMALPGVFSPVTLEGKVLSDGGMMRNLPVDIGRELCADVVIAVWMSSPPAEAAGLTSALSLIGRSIDVMIGANERAANREPDAARRGDRRADGRHRHERLHARSRKPSSSAGAPRTACASSSAATPSRRPNTSPGSTRLSRTQAPETQLAEVRIVGTERVNPEYVRAQLETPFPARS